jgi:hypothetical protein
MKDEDLLQCPLLRGLDAMHRAELLGFINDSSLREKLEECIQRTPGNDASKVCAEESKNFEKDVHSWNPQKLVFSRSPKE